LNILGDKNPVHLITAPGSARRKLQHVDARKFSKLGARSDRADRSEERDKEDISNIRFEAAMCYLRGVCYAKQNAFDRAKECYKDAVRIDVQCFEAFDQLMKNSLMSPREEWKFLESLNFDTIMTDNVSSSQEASDFTKMLYTTRLSKYEHPEEFTVATETLSTHYNLATNPDILLSKAELLFTQCRFKEALALTSAILEKDRYNFNTFPIHLACLHELNEKNALFLLAHDLADNHPEEPSAWLAIGVYYLTINRIAEARRFFSKASMMDPHFGPAWIGFAHTFAAEGEHDQAISAYSTAARLFQGTHLPQLFLGMQNLQLNNMPLAHEYLNTAYGLCKTDPLLLNELGVVLYHEEDLQNSIALFKLALTLAQEIGSDPRAWLSTRANLGHALRRTGQFAEALDAFNDVLRSGGKDAGVFCAKGLVLLEMGDIWQAVIALHEALAVSPQDPIATDLLGKALEVNEAVPLMGDSEEEELERRIGGRKAEAAKGKTRRRPRGRLSELDVTGAGESMLVDSDDD
jgi:anaphase-promoting complex subunit 6